MKGRRLIAKQYDRAIEKWKYLTLKTATTSPQKAVQRSKMATKYSKNWQRLRPTNIPMAAFSRKQSLEITCNQSTCQNIHAPKALSRDITSSNSQNFASCIGLCNILHKPTINPNKRQTNQEYTYLLLINCLQYLLLPLVTVTQWLVRQQYVKNAAPQKIDCKCMLNLTSYSSIHCYGTYFCVQYR